MYRKDILKPIIIECMSMRLSEKKTIEYLADKGYKISRSYLKKLQHIIKESAQDRLNLIASEQFILQHMERIDILQTILSEMWKNYHECKDPYKRNQILVQIEENQTYLAAFYDSTQYILQTQALLRKKKKQEIAA